MIGLTNITTNKGNDVLTLSNQSPVMLVFLRHFGCIYCRQSLKDLSKKKDYLAKNNIKVVFVHMTEPEIAEMYFEKHDLAGFEHVSDISCQLYQDFGLTKGNFNQLFGLKNMIKGFEATMQGTFISLKQVGDGFQMPGIFMLKKGEIIHRFIHRVASDQPNYELIVNSCIEK